MEANCTEFKYQLALLRSLRGSKSPESDLGQLLIKYPEVVRVIPHLLACRERRISILNATGSPLRSEPYDFSKDNYSSSEVQRIIDFCKRSGLLSRLCKTESPKDYLTGVEVGLDSNARKNRSGAAFEAIVKEQLRSLVSKHSDITWLAQKEFRHVEQSLNIPVPPALRDRKFDHIFVYGRIATNLEVNYFSGPGSKPSEIGGSYAERSNLLRNAGWRFVWLTDGGGWKRMERPLRINVGAIDYLLNLHLLRAGLLSKLILGV